MSEEIKEAIVEEKTAETTEESKAISKITTDITFNEFSWLDYNMTTNVYKIAKVLSQSQILPKRFRGDVGSTMLIMEMSAKLGGKVPFQSIAHNLYMINDQPCWSGKFCRSLIDISGLFKNVKYNWYYDLKTGEIEGCSVQAVRIEDGEVCYGSKISWDTVKGFGWDKKPNSMWMIPGQREQMYMYRASEYFLNAFCPAMLCGMYTVESQKDISGNRSNETVKVELKG